MGDWNKDKFNLYFGKNKILKSYLWKVLKQTEEAS